MAATVWDRCQHGGVQLGASAVQGLRWVFSKSLIQLRDIYAQRSLNEGLSRAVLGLMLGGVRTAGGSIGLY